MASDPGVAGLLEKVAVLKQRMSARRSLGGLFADKASKRAGRKHHKRDRGSRRSKHKRGSDASSGTSSDKGDAFHQVCSRDGNRQGSRLRTTPASFDLNEWLLLVVAGLNWLHIVGLGGRDPPICCGPPSKVQGEALGLLAGEVSQLFHQCGGNMK